MIDKCPKMHQNWSQNVYNSKNFLVGGHAPQTPLTDACFTHIVHMLWLDYLYLACSRADVQSPSPMQYVHSPSPMQYFQSPSPTQCVQSPSPTQCVQSPSPTQYVQSSNPTQYAHSPSPIQRSSILAWLKIVLRVDAAEMWVWNVQGLG